MSRTIVNGRLLVVPQNRYVCPWSDPVSGCVVVGFAICALAPDLR